MLETLVSSWIPGSLYLCLVFRSQYVNGDSSKKTSFVLNNDFFANKLFCIYASEEKHAKEAESLLTIKQFNLIMGYPEKRYALYSLLADYAELYNKED